MRKRTLKKGRIQWLVSILFFFIGIIAACILAVKNLSWTEMPVAVVGILLGIFGLWGILNARNFYVIYDEKEITVRDFRRRVKKFYYQDLEGFYCQNRYEDIILCFKNGKIVLDDATEGREYFLKTADHKYTEYHNGKSLPEFWERSRHTWIFVMLAICEIFLVSMGIGSMLPAREENMTEFYGQIHADPLDHYSGFMYFYMEGKQLRINDHKMVLMNKAQFQKEISAGQNFYMETTREKNKNGEYYNVRYLEDEEGNVFLSYASSGRVKMAVLLITAGGIFLMTAVMWVADRNKKKYAKIYELFFRD